MSDNKASDVVMSEGRQTRRFGLRSLFSRSKLPFLLGLVVLIVLLAGGGYLLLTRGGTGKSDTSQQTDKTTVSSPLKPVVVKQEQLSVAELTKKVNFLIGTKQYADAESLIRYQSDLDTSKEKLTLLSSVLQTEGKASEAADVSAKVAKLSDLQPGDYAVIAQNYEAAGDKNKASQYYQKAIDGYNQQKRGSYKSTVTRLEAKIKELQQ